MNPLVRRQSYMALDVQDLDACVKDALDIAGLQLVERTDDRAILTSNSRHAELVLYRAAENAARRVGLEAPDVAAVAQAIASIRDAGLRILSETPSLACIDRSVTFATSEGHILEVHTPIPETQRRRYPGPGIHPKCIDHVNLAAIDPWAIHLELQKAIGLKLSERSTHNELMWMRAANNRHHTVGIAKSTRSGLHHYCWEFTQFTDFMRLGDVLASEDRMMVWGPGRHGAGDNLFTYYVDIAGFLIECSSEMESVEADAPPRVVDAPSDLSNAKLVNCWGTLPPRAWLEHHSSFVQRKDAYSLAG
jgi:catechol 2,3-dioxygenase